MKNSKTIFAFAVLAALASCSNEHVISQPDEVATPIRIKANVGAVATKAATDVQNTQFDNGEKVNVYIFENKGDKPNEEYTYGEVEYTADGSGNLNTTTTQYYPANGHGIDVIGVYPTTVTMSTNQKFSVNEDQSSPDKYKMSDLMFASVSNHTKKYGDVKLDFKHQLSKIIVKLNRGNGLNENDLLNATVKICGTVRECEIPTVSLLGMGTIAKKDGGSPSNITVGEWTSDVENDGIAAIVVPQVVPKGTTLFEVTLQNSGATYSYTTPTEESSQNVVFQPGTVHTYTLTLTTGEIELSSTITPWKQGHGDSYNAELKYPDSNN